MKVPSVKFASAVPSHSAAVGRALPRLRASILDTVGSLKFRSLSVKIGRTHFTVAMPTAFDKPQTPRVITQWAQLSFVKGGAHDGAVKNRSSAWSHFRDEHFQAGMQKFAEYSEEKGYPAEGTAVLICSGANASRRNFIHVPILGYSERDETLDLVFKAAGAALKVAGENHFQSLIFPPLGTGIGHLSYRDCAWAIMRNVLLLSIDRVVIPTQVTILAPTTLEMDEAYESMSAVLSQLTYYKDKPC